MTYLKQSTLCGLLLVSACSGLFASSTVPRKHVHHITSAARAIDGNPVVGIDKLNSAEMLRAGDQRLLRFNASEGVNPVITISNPSQGTVTILECAARTASGKTVDAKTASSLENLVVLRDQGFCDYGKRWDIKHDKYRARNAPVAAVAEDLMKAMSLITVKDYSGTVFVDEYTQGIPMVITVDKVEQLRGLQAYFIKHKVAARTQKPWVLIEVSKNPEAVTQADLDFWSGLFDVKQRSDDGIYDFIKDERDLRYDISAIGVQSKDYIRSAPADQLLLRLEKAAGDLKTQKLLMALLALVVVDGVWKRCGPEKMMNEVIRDLSPETTDNLKTAAAVTLVAAAAYTAYRLYMNALDGNAVDTDEVDSVATEESATPEVAA